MKTILLTSIFCLLNLISFSQDTLFFKNAGKLEVIVKEVSPTEIQYKKFEMPDGPMYIVNRSDIEKIVYKNGYTEILKPSTPPATASADTPSQELTVYNQPVSVNYDKINYADTKRRQSALVDLVLRHPDPKRRDPLMSAAANLRRMKVHQDGTRTGAIIFGGVAIAGTLLYTTIYTFSSGNTNGLEVFAVPPVLFGAAGVALGAVSISINANLKKKRHEFVRAYNE